jgi:hypothetical protein
MLLYVTKHTEFQGRMLRLSGKHSWMKMFNMRYWLSGGKSEDAKLPSSSLSVEYQLMYRFITKPLNRSFDFKEDENVADE